MVKISKTKRKLEPEVKTILNFGDGITKIIDIPIGNPHKGEQLQYSGVIFDILNVRYHYKGGYTTWMELFLTESDDNTFTLKSMGVDLKDWVKHSYGNRN